MIAKQWIAPTKNLMAQMLRTLTRTQAAAMAAKQGQSNEGTGEGVQADAEHGKDNSSSNAIEDDSRSLSGMNIENHGTPDGNESIAGGEEADHPDLAALIRVASMAGIKENVIRKAWELGLAEGRNLSSALTLGTGSVPELSMSTAIPTKPGICAAPGCNEPAKVKGLCVKHYRKMRYAESRRAMGLTYRPRREGGTRPRKPRQSTRPSIPQYALEVLREVGAPMSIDRICELVQEKAKDIELPELRVLRARVRHFLYTSPKTERAGRGMFQIKGGPNRVLRRPGVGVSVPAHQKTKEDGDIEGTGTP